MVPIPVGSLVRVDGRQLAASPFAWMARGSWLVARGSWLVARGSWLVVPSTFARGSAAALVRAGSSKEPI